MAPPYDADFPFSVDRWAIRLEEPQPNPVLAGEPDPEPEPEEPPTPPFLLEIPNDEFQPRLSRFDEAA